MSGKDQKIISTLAKNLGINSDDELVLTLDLVVDTIRESDPFSGKIIQKTDLLGEGLPVDWGSLVEDNGSAIASVADEHTGVFRLTTGTDDDGKAAIHAQLNWMGDKNAIFECRVTTPATITTYKLEIGLNDNLTTEAWGVLAEDGSGDASTDAIIFIWDKDKHATKLWAAGTKNGTGWGGIDLGVTMEAATTYDFKIVLADDNAVMYYKKVGTHTTWQTLHTITGGTALTKTVDVTPWIVVVARANAASRTLDVDRIGMEQDR
ncbi:hypothetical protein KAR91_56890 [Candidatus Pacearchaeota archaeon]|nr:hypothetical protein [Candidatus Pacearchaeota archaeon]